MPGTVRHKHTGIAPAQASPLSTDVDGADWLAEHVFESPEIGAILVGDPTVSDHVGWITTVVLGKVLASRGVGVQPEWIDAPEVTFPTVAEGDLIVGGDAGVAIRLPAGSGGTFLRSDGFGVLSWEQLPDELPVGSNGSFLVYDDGWTPLSPGADGQILIMSGGAPLWVDNIFVPMGSVGGMLRYMGDTTLQVINPGTEGQVLTIAGGVPQWAALGGAGGWMMNPMTIMGDMVVGGLDGIPQRLGVGLDGQVLGVVGSMPTWQTPATVPLTERGDLLTTHDGIAAARVAIGGPGQVLTVVDGLPEWAAASSGFANPMLSMGDLIIGATAGSPIRLGRGAFQQVLAVATTGSLEWITLPAFDGMANPMTAQGDLIIGGVAGAAARLPVGAAARFLRSDGITPEWAVLPVDPGFANPMTTAGDLIVGSVAGAPIRLPISSEGTVLTVNGGVVAWQFPPTGMTNPMTTVGDLIIGNVGGAATRLPAGANGRVLTLAAGVPSWAVLPVDPGFANPMTSVGDLIVGGASGAPGRLAVGAAGTVLVGGASPAWSAFPTLTNLSIVGFTEGGVVFAGTGGFLAEDDANFFWDDTANALRLFGGAMGTAGAKILTLGQGSFPSTRPADSVQMLVQDLFGAGTAGLTIVPEGAGTFLFGGTTVDSIFQLTNSPVTLRLSATTAMASVGPSTAHPLGFITNNAQKMVIESDGRMGLNQAAVAGWQYSITGGAGNHLALLTQSSTGTGKSILQVTNSTSSRFVVDDGATSPISLVVAALFRALQAGAPDSGGAGYRMLRVAN